MVGVLLFIMALPISSLAHEPANEHFQRTWERTDQPVATSDATRTWMWGPEGFTANCAEPYHKLTAGQREVQYFDKSRMEITDPSGDPTSDWYVTQGLLATEMITGRMQISDHERIDWHPADVHIAGDPGGGAPSYADFAPLMDMAPHSEGTTITQTLGANGLLGQNDVLADYGVTASEYVSQTDHRVASVFWEFMNSQGTILENGSTATGPLFSNPFYAVGYPLTEAYWTNIEVDGVAQDVLVQAFERRVLTYTPENPDGWQVEAGNVGQHYYIWRYGEIPEDSTDACPESLSVTFTIYEQRNGEWDEIALSTTREVWHPGDLATGTWSTYTGTDGEILAINSSGFMVGEHEFTQVGGQRILSGLNAEIVQLHGPVTGSASISAGNFSLGNDPRVPGSRFIGSGSVSYQAGDDSGELGIEIAATSTNTFHIFLDGPAPPVFFQ